MFFCSLQDFEFQQLCKVRVTPAPSGIPNPRVQWLTSSSRYGLTFVASDNGKMLLEFIFLTSDKQM